MAIAPGSRDRSRANVVASTHTHSWGQAAPAAGVGLPRRYDMTDTPPTEVAVVDPAFSGAQR